MKRTRNRTEQEREALVKQYRASGKTQRVFCAEAGVSLAALTLWLRRGRSRAVSENQLIEVPVEKVARAVEPSGGVEVILPAMVVRVAAGTPTNWASELIRKLQCGA